MKGQGAPQLFHKDESSLGGGDVGVENNMDSVLTGDACYDAFCLQQSQRYGQQDTQAAKLIRTKGWGM